MHFLYCWEVSFIPRCLQSEVPLWCRIFTNCGELLFSGLGIPTLVILDENLKVVTNQGRAMVDADAEGKVGTIAESRNL